jgi:hypothetical protein
MTGAAGDSDLHERASNRCAPLYDGIAPVIEDEFVDFPKPFGAHMVSRG